MPIKKRTSIPVPKVVTKSVGHFVTPGLSLESLLREANQRESDAAWSDEHELAKKQRAIADNLRTRIEAGELYEVDF
jgi:hypothetical protein